MKKSKIIIPLLSSFLLTFAAATLVNHNHQSKINVANASAVADLDLTTLPFSNTPVAGWGNVNVNTTCDGNPIVVNSVTYSKGFGTHVHNDAASIAADMEFDISSLSNQYEFFEAGVAQPATGNNCIRFAVLVDGVEKDYVVWRCGYGDGNPYKIRCSIKGGQKLTLRTQCTNWGYASGTSVWVNPRLFALDADSDQLPASYFLKRSESTTGWGAYLGGDYAYAHAMFDQRVNGTSFSVFAPYGDPSQFTTGIGTQLKGGTYETYAADKTNADYYASLKFDIKGRGFTLFNTTASMGAGGGSYIDAWIDGVEVYHHTTMISAANAGDIINVPLPTTAEELEIRVVANNGFGDGLVDLLGANFLKGNQYLYTYAGVDIKAPEYAWPVVRGGANNGRALVIRDSASSSDVAAVKGLMLHQNGSYTFNVDGIEYDTLSGKIGASADEPLHGANRLKATFTYADETTFALTSDEFSYANSNIDFSFSFYPTNLKTIKLELIGDLANSKSVINAALFSNEVSNLNTFIDEKLKMSTYTEELGWCADAEHHYYADAKEYFNETLSDDERTLLLEADDNVIYANAKARLLAWAAANGDTVTSNNKLDVQNSIVNITSSNQSGLLVLIISLLTIVSICGLVVLNRRKHHN